MGAVTAVKPFLYRACLEHQSSLDFQIPLPLKIVSSATCINSGETVGIVNLPQNYFFLRR